MAHQSTRQEYAEGTAGFYRRTLHVLSDAQVPFLVGGSHAFLRYTGIERDTKDLDLFLRREDLDRALCELADNGYRTEVAFRHWLGKAYYKDDFVDLVFGSGNGVAKVDDAWFANAVEEQVLGVPVKLVPAEEFVWQKAFVMERERFDGADILHVFHQYGEKLDWDRLVARFAPHREILLAYVVLFFFVYPSERSRIPERVTEGLLQSLRVGAAPGGDGAERADGARVCRGTLLSRAQFLVDIGRWGYRDARIAPLGGLTPEDAVYWTWAIDHLE
jgi:hypothetical protein